MAKAVFGLVDTERQAKIIVENLKVAGFRNNDISVLFPDKGGTRDFAHEKATKAPEGAAAGAGTGTVVGGVLGCRRHRLLGYPRRRTLYCSRTHHGCACGGWRRCGSGRPFRCADRI